MWKTAISILSLLLATASFAEEKVGEIEDTTKMVRRVEARSYAAFALGPAIMQGVGTKQTGKFLKLGYLWETTPHAAVKISGQGSFNFDDYKASILAGTLGANFYLTRTSISPYAGFDFGYGVAATGADDLDSVHGWAAGANLGVAFFRTSSVQMHLSVSYLSIFAETGDGQPGQAVVSLGILF